MAKYLPRLATGELISSFALTEPDVGFDAGAVRTTERRDGDDYILNGTKRFITNGPRARLFTVFARTDPSTKDASGVSALRGRSPETRAEARAEGQEDGPGRQLHLRRDFRGLPGSRLGAARRPGEYRLQDGDEVLDRGRLHISAICVGAAERLIHESLQHAMDRKQFGEPIAEKQLIQAMLADSRTEAHAARCMVENTARLKDQGVNVAEEAASTKMFAPEMVGRVANRAVQIHGGAGYMQEYAVERFYRDVRLFQIYEGTTRIQQIVIARHAAQRPPQR